MKPKINKIAFIIVNAIAFVSLGVILLIKFIMSDILFYILFAAWLIFIIFINYDILIKSADIKNTIKAADKRHRFTLEVNILIKNYDEIENSRKFFETTGQSVMDTYELVRKQVYSNIKSAVQYMEYASMSGHNDPVPEVYTLCESNEKLLDKLQDLVGLVIKIDSRTDDVDTSSIEYIIESLKELLEENEQ